MLKEEPSGQTVYVYGTDGHNVLGEYRQSSTSTTVQRTEHIYLPTASGPMPVATVINGQHYAVHSDHLNTPRRLTDSALRVRWQWATSGYGETPAQPLAVGSLATVPYHLRYPGQVDDGNGLFYNWHRFYHPASGRYVSADPIGLAGGWNRFGYADGNPMGATDPTGLHPVLARLQGLYYRYGPAITEFVAAAAGVNGTVVAPAAVSPLVAQIPTGVSRLASVAKAVAEAIDSGAYCVPKSVLQVTQKGLARVENHLDDVLQHEGLSKSFQAGERGMLDRLR